MMKYDWGGELIWIGVSYFLFEEVMFKLRPQ